MFKALWQVQWKWTRAIALLVTIIGFSIPVISVRVMHAGSDSYRPPAAVVVSTMQMFGIAYSILAGGAGLAFALLAWSSDHRGRHVYALSLPVSRARYAGMKFLAGLSFLLLPAVGVLMGSLVALLMGAIPGGLQAYPVALTIRFFLASAVAYSIFFAISASSTKAAGLVLGTLSAVFLAAFILSTASIQFDLLGHVATLLFAKGGLLSIFTGRWMLIDV
jgi:hypothetical protein